MKLKQLIVVISLALAAPVSASSQTGGYVVGFGAIPGNIVLVGMTGSRTSPPGCSNPALPNRWALDLNSAMGQVYLSLLMSAQSLHQPVDVYGTGTCSVLGDGETIATIITNHIQ